MKKVAIVLAAGMGVRMKSDLPKVSHLLAGKPLITWVLSSLQPLGLDQIFIVVGYKAEIVKKECKGFKVTFVEQKDQLGTGHAVKQVGAIESGSLVLVLNGDVPLIRTDTLRDLMNAHIESEASATVLTANLDDPGSYGRVIRSSENRLSRIVEQKDASEDEKKIKEINSGTYCFNSTELFSALDQVRPNNAQKEYYLTDVIKILNDRKRQVFAFTVNDPSEVLGVNTKEDLARLEEIYGNAPRIK